MDDIVDTDIVVVLRHGQVVEGSDEMRLMYHTTLLSAADELTQLRAKLSNQRSTIRTQMVRHKRDRATIAKLPKTADGVPVIPCLTPIYHPREIGGDGPATLHIHSNNLYWADRGWNTGTPAMLVSECYSTKAAAEAAKSEGE